MICDRHNKECQWYPLKASKVLRCPDCHQETLDAEKAAITGPKFRCGVNFHRDVGVKVKK